MKQNSNIITQVVIGIVVILVAVASSLDQVEAGQGCPFDNIACRDYCNQQGCSLGYCGHFAWIQCICRKCGNEWSYYDKIRFTNHTVNQTELESLKLNQSEPIMVMTIVNDSNGTTATTTVNITENIPSELEIVTFDGIEPVLAETIADTQNTSTSTTSLEESGELPTELTHADISVEAKTETSTSESSTDQSVSFEQVGDDQQPSTTTETSEPSGTLLVPDLTDEQIEEHNNNTDANEIDDTSSSTSSPSSEEDNTDKLLELAEKHYNKLRQQKQNETKTIDSINSEIHNNNEDEDLLLLNHSNRRRKRNIINKDQIRAMMYRI